MKKLLALLLFLCSVYTFAQDVIVKKDGSTIVCRVVELNASQIIYKKWTDLSGDDRVMPRSDASAINYQDGRKINLSEAENQYAPNNQSDGSQLMNDNALLQLDYDRRHRKGKENKLERLPKQISKVESLRRKKQISYFVAGIGGAIALTGLVMMGSSWEAEDGVHTGTHNLGIAVGGFGAGVCLIGILTGKHYVKKIKAEQAIQTASIYQQELKFNNGTSFMSSVDILKDNVHNNQAIGIGFHYNF